ncbi:cupredoxin domain-containing protein [Candidatus Gottesmanbacteria bacterium]|nr:cupredoxin domain-containing protein [Candidatus Gottesmanbacteria bacterium]
MGNKVIFGAVVLLIGGFLGWYVYTNGLYGGVNQGAKSGSEEMKLKTSSATGTDESVFGSTGSEGVTKGGTSLSERSSVQYTDAGFAPKALTVKKGTTVTFTNKSSRSMWVASAPHPSHTILPEFDELIGVANGQTYTFTFEKVGTWKYHNHLNPSDFGSVAVNE